MTEPQSGFERVYAGVGSNLRSVPWALLEPHPNFVEWLDGQVVEAGATALVVGCGLGDDAEEASRRGYTVTAFDIAPSALRLARRRFKRSTVDYQEADLLALPDTWRGAFDLVVEIRTLQSVPRAERRAAIRQLAASLKPGGLAFVRGMLGQRGAAGRGRRPLPLLPAELAAFTDCGLRELDFRELPEEGAFVGLYQAPTEETGPQSSR